MSDDPYLTALAHLHRTALEKERAKDDKLTKAYASIKDALEFLFSPEGMNYHRSTIIEILYELLDEVTGDNDQGNIY